MIVIRFLDAGLAEDGTLENVFFCEIRGLRGHGHVTCLSLHLRMCIEAVRALRDEVRILMVISSLHLYYVRCVNLQYSRRSSLLTTGPPFPFRFITTFGFDRTT